MIRRLFSKNRKLLSKFKQLTGLTPTNLHLYETAFQHSSLSDIDYNSNERLEFLGDAILSAIVADYLYKKFPYKDEGYLTDMRSKMVSRNQLNSIAQKMGIDQLLKFNGNDSLINKKSLSGNALEALVGAVYLDKGFKSAEKFILQKIIKPFLDIEDLEISEFNYKSKLLEWSQKSGKQLSFSLLIQSRVKHRTFYKVAAIINGESFGIGEDSNKKNAEKQAAKKTFEILKLNVEEFM